MPDESNLLRLRACECRRLAADAKNGYSRRTLTHMANELDEEADKIEGEEGGFVDPQIGDSIDRLSRSNETLRKTKPD